jgi:hypothetical protein
VNRNSSNPIRSFIVSGPLGPQCPAFPCHPVPQGTVGGATAPWYALFTLGGDKFGERVEGINFHGGMRGVTVEPFHAPFTRAFARIHRYARGLAVVPVGELLGAVAPRVTQLHTRRLRVATARGATAPTTIELLTSHAINALDAGSEQAAVVVLRQLPVTDLLLGAHHTVTGVVAGAGLAALFVEGQVLTGGAGTGAHGGGSEASGSCREPSKSVMRRSIHSRLEPRECNDWKESVENQRVFS